MKPIPTAEEFFKKNSDKPASEVAIAFTKLHVKAALVEVEDCGENCFGDLVYRKEKKITTLYPLSNIK